MIFFPFWEDTQLRQRAEITLPQSTQLAYTQRQDSKAWESTNLYADPVKCVSHVITHVGNEPSPL